MVVLSTLRSRWATFAGSFVALAIGVSLIAVMGLGLAATFDPPEGAPERFASSPVVVMGTDKLTVEVERGPGTARVSLAHPRPVGPGLVRELRALGRVVVDGTARDAVGVDAAAEDVRRVVGDRVGAAVSAVNLAGGWRALGSLSVPVVVAPWAELAVAAAGLCAVVAVLAGLLSCPGSRPH